MNPVKKRIICRALLLALTASTLLFFPACNAAKHKIDYCGQKEFYDRPPESCSAGKKVELCYKGEFVATDTDYTFFVDGEKASAKADDDGNIILRFVMPDHDVRVRCFANVTMREAGDLMLVDYYDAVTGTDGGDRSYELVLNLTTDDSIRLDVYNASYGTEETCVSYYVDYGAVDESLDVIEKYKMNEWNQKDGIAIDGTVTVCRFILPGGGFERVSSDNMPEDGTEAFSTVRQVLEKYLSAGEPATE